MDLTHNAFGTWSGGRFMHFGESLTEERFISLIRLAYDSGIRTFVTSDVYGVGRADQILGQALNDFDRESYCLVGCSVMISMKEKERVPKGIQDSVIPLCVLPQSIRPT